MRIHLIAIGGAVMHNLALELLASGDHVTGSDDEIYEPARSRLEQFNLLPQQLGWYPDRITPDIDQVILGMHAHLDNPELLKAQNLGLQVLSFPDFVYSRTKNKKRIVVCGSHGKTTTTSMIMHVLRKKGLEFDYLVGGLVPGFDRMVRLNASSTVAIIEGDEYLSSRLDPVPKMLKYRGEVVIITGIAWDHMNVFPTLENYEGQFNRLLNVSSDLTTVIWYHGDQRLAELIAKQPKPWKSLPYDAFATRSDGRIVFENQDWEIEIFGDHNMANARAAMLACQTLNIAPADFLAALADFKGAGKRLEQIGEDPVIFRDFAHAPSKVRASVKAVRQKYPHNRLLAVVELHTYSSLNRGFISQYIDSASEADQLIVFYSPETVRLKRLEPLDHFTIERAFGHPNAVICDDPQILKSVLHEKMGHCDVSLFMSSGHFGGLDISQLAMPEQT